MKKRSVKVVEPKPQSDADAKKLGRKRDHTRDADILKAALEELAESGYAGMTMDAVAERAGAGKATLYRRWPSKEELVLDAVSQMKQAQADINQLPDTGTLRGDLLALVKPQSTKESDFKLKVMSGLSTLLAQNDSLAEAGAAAIVEPWAQVYRILVRRSIERGEAKSASVSDIETIIQIVPSMMAFRAVVLRKPFDRNFLTSLVDTVVLPALGVAFSKSKVNKSIRSKHV